MWREISIIATTPNAILIKTVYLLDKQVIWLVWAGGLMGVPQNIVCN